MTRVGYRTVVDDGLLHRDAGDTTAGMPVCDRQSGLLRLTIATPLDSYWDPGVCVDCWGDQQTTLEIRTALGGFAVTYVGGPGHPSVPGRRYQRLGPGGRYHEVSAPERLVLETMIAAGEAYADECRNCRGHGVVLLTGTMLIHMT